MSIGRTLRRCLPAPVFAAVARFSGSAKRGYQRVSHLGTDSNNKWIARSAECGGWLFEGEHDQLWQWACDSTEGDILEIGTWMGKSACIFAGACLETSPEARVWCIDPFLMLGSDAQARYHKQLVRGAGGTFYQFIDNAQRLGFYDQVIPLATVSEVALQRVPDESLRLAFVDGRHDYQGVSTDTRLVLPKLRVGGILALHDATVYDDVARHIAEDLRRDDRLAWLGQVNSLAGFRRIA